MNKDQFEKFVTDRLDDLREKYRQGTAFRDAEAQLLCLKNDKGETFTEDRPAMIFMAMAGLGDQRVRETVKDAAWENEGIAVMVKLEAWFVQLTDDMDAETKAKATEAAATQTIDKLEPPLRREKILVYVEGVDHPLRLFEAEILPDGSGLAPWSEPEIRLPRPNFRRYMPENRDGKRTRVFHI